MASSLAAAAGTAHPERLRITPRPAKATLDSPKNLRKLDEWKRDAEDCVRALQLARVETLKEAAVLLDMGPSQLAEQLAARERPQTERFRGHDRLRGPYLIAQAERQPDLFDVVTTIHVRRTA